MYTCKRHSPFSIQSTYIVFFRRFIDESITWLLANGKRKEAEKVLQKAALISDVSIPRDVLTSDDVKLMKVDTNKIEENETAIEKDPTYQIWDIFRYKKMVMYTLILWFVWSVRFSFTHLNQST